MGGEREEEGEKRTSSWVTRRWEGGEMGKGKGGGGGGGAGCFFFVWFFLFCFGFGLGGVRRKDKR